MGRYSGNPVINVESRCWVMNVIRVDGMYYAYLNIIQSADSARVTYLYIGETPEDLTPYSGNPIIDSDRALNDVWYEDGMFYFLTMNRVTYNVELFYSEDGVDLTLYGEIYSDSDCPWVSAGDKILHSDILMHDGIYVYSAVDQDDHEQGILSSEYSFLDITGHDVVLSAQTGWESGSITNPHEKVIDGVFFVKYSAGPHGSDRDIGVRWGDYWDELNTNYKTAALIVANGGAFEDGYVNIGDSNIMSGFMYYFGYGQEATGIFKFDYENFDEITRSLITYIKGGSLGLGV